MTIVEHASSIVIATQRFVCKDFLCAKKSTKMVISRWWKERKNKQELESIPVMAKIITVYMSIFSHFNRLSAINVNFFFSFFSQTFFFPLLQGIEQNYCHFQRNINIYSATYYFELPFNIQKFTFFQVRNG